MSYYIAKEVELNFEDAEAKVRDTLQEQGFGILTSVDMQAKLKEKVGANLKKYKILGACNPPFAYKALSAEERIGLMLPCNVIVREKQNGKTEVAAIDPVIAMSAVKNDSLSNLAAEVRDRLQAAIEKV